ncbi:19256_t:CDS:1, partial [Funneliformis geosporum]
SLGLTVLYQGQMIENIRGFVNEDIYLVNPNLVENYTTYQCIRHFYPKAATSF